MTSNYIYSSLTRISPLADVDFEVEMLSRKNWDNGDYVLGRIELPPSGHSVIELVGGRMRPVMQGDWIVGALGKRRATLEVTGTWKKVGEDGRMHVLTSAGLFGKLVSKSPFAQTLMDLKYSGHVMLGGKKATMQRFLPPIQNTSFDVPVILLVGTSMSAGKTTSARIVVRHLKKAGLKVLGAKLTGAGRYRDIQGMQDAGADHIFDFVDVGLPSTIHPPSKYRPLLEKLLSMMAGVDADVAVAEIGSSPLEPYNGAAAIDAIRDNIRCTILCASDPYAVVGVMSAYGMEPTLVTGPATNTRAGIELSEKLSGVRTLNIIEPSSGQELDTILRSSLADVISNLAA